MRSWTFPMFACVIGSCAGKAEPVKIQEDSLLKRVEQSLPENWSCLVEEPASLILRRKGTVWVLFENRINAPVSRESDEERAQRVHSTGKEMHCEVVFRCESRWSDERLRTAIEENEKLQKRIDALPKKHGIVHLYHEHLSRKGTETYVPNTPDEERAVSAYQMEKNLLESNRIRLPDFHSERYSLFLTTRSGSEDDLHLVHPEEASRELMQVEGKVRDLLEKR